MVNHAEWFTEKTNRKVQINSLVIYKDLSNEIVEKLEDNLLVSEILKWIIDQTKEVFRDNYARNLEGGAINNAVGRWNEFIATSLLSEIIFEMNQENENCVAIFSLLNSRLQKQEADEASSKFLTLFSNDEFAPGKVLEKLATIRRQIFLSSPDYIIVALNNCEKFTLVQSLLEQQAKTPDSLELYKFFKGKLQIEEIKATVSLKTSNRPDRRYQPLFEAAMIKSMSYLLQQTWKYYMVVSDLNDADRTIFSIAVAPHGIVLEKNLKLVDGAYLYTKKEDLVPLVKAALKSSI